MEKTGKLNHPRHGMANTPENRIWRTMIQRCTNPNDNRYQSYGARGITVCERWRNSFLSFYADMGAKPSPKHSIDRIDNDGNYEPGNCRWATSQMQARNKSVRQSSKSGVTGVSPTRYNTWQAYIKVEGKSIHLGAFRDKQDAIVARKAAEQKYFVST